MENTPRLVVVPTVLVVAGLVVVPAVVVVDGLVAVPAVLVVDELVEVVDPDDDEGEVEVVDVVVVEVEVVVEVAARLSGVVPVKVQFCLRDATQDNVCTAVPAPGEEIHPPLAD
jgi:hypothetical protein